MSVLQRSFFVLALASLIASASLREACQTSVHLRCPKEVAAMDRTAARACLIRNIAKATPACRDAVQAFKAQHPNAAPN